MRPNLQTITVKYYLRSICLIAFSILALIIGNIQFISFAQDSPKKLIELASGPPNIFKKNLGDQSYVTVITKKLANAKVIWINKDYFRARKMAIPSEKEVLDSFAWGIHSPGEPFNAFLKEEKIFMADRYGGGGLALNQGSGRAASAGDFQIKGIGRTPLVGEKMKNDHANGLVPFHEYREAIFGEINQDLPHKGNRVVAIIDRGTEFQLKDGKTHRAIMIIREDPLRPAHFVEAWHAGDKFKISELKRVKQASQYFINSLPLPLQYQNSKDSIKIREGMYQYTKNIAEQFATAYSQKLYHGGTSLSNIEINGRWLDYGTQTSQPGYGPIQILDHIEHSGKVEQIESTFISEFITEIQKKFPPEISQYLPSNRELKNLFKSHYQQKLEQNFLKLTGIPDTIIDKIYPMYNSSSFAKSLINTAQAGGKNTVGRFKVPEKITSFDLAEILTVLSDNWPSDVTHLAKALTPLMPGAINSISRKILAQDYSHFMSKVEEIALEEGILKDALIKFIRINVKLKNKKTPDIYRWKMMDEDFKLIAQYNNDFNPIPIRKIIDKRIANSKRNFEGLNPFHALIEEKIDSLTGGRIRFLFDATRDTYKVELIMPTNKAKNKAYLFGKKIMLTPSGPNNLQYKLSNQLQTKVKWISEIDNNKDFIKLSIPLSNTQGKLTIFTKSKRRAAIELTSISIEVPDNTLKKFNKFQSSKCNTVSEIIAEVLLTFKNLKIDTKL